MCECELYLNKLLKEGDGRRDWLLSPNGRVSLKRKRNPIEMEKYETDNENLNRLDKLLIESF